MADFINNEQQNFGPVGIQSQEVSNPNDSKMEEIKQELEKLNKSTLDIHQLINESRDQIIQALLNNKNVNTEEVQEEKETKTEEATDLTDKTFVPLDTDYPTSPNTNFVGESPEAINPTDLETNETIEKEAESQELVETTNEESNEESIDTEQTIELPIVPGFGEEQTLEAPAETVSNPEPVMQSEVKPMVDQQEIEEFSPVSVSTIETQEPKFVPIDEIIGNAEAEPATIPMSVEDQQVAPVNSVQPAIQPVAPVETAPVQNVVPTEPSPTATIDPVITSDVIVQPVIQPAAPVEAVPVQNVAPTEPNPAPKVTIVTKLYPINEVKTEGQHRVEKVAAGVNENIAKLGEQKTLVNSIAA